MQPQTYRHTIRFCGSANPSSKYQLQISEITHNGQLLYRAQWDFPTLRNLLTFLKKYFPHSQALTAVGHQPSLAFDDVLAVVGF